MRVNFNVPDSLVVRLDEYARDTFTSRSSVMCQACDQFLTAQEAKKMLGQMTLLLKKITDEGTIDEETMKQIETFDSFCKLLGTSIS